MFFHKFDVFYQFLCLILMYAISSLVTNSGTAIAGADFTSHSTQLTFSPGNAGPKLVQIPLIDNNRVEGDEQFSVLLSTTDSDVNIVNSPATVTIIDDDGRLNS